jgi:hypothetical protein
MKRGRHRYGEQKGELVLWVDEAGASSLRGSGSGSFPKDSTGAEAGVEGGSGALDR